MEIQLQGPTFKPLLTTDAIRYSHNKPTNQQTADPRLRHLNLPTRAVVCFFQAGRSRLSTAEMRKHRNAYQECATRRKNIVIRLHIVRGLVRTCSGSGSTFIACRAVDGREYKLCHHPDPNALV